MPCPLKKNCEYYKKTSIACEVDFKRAYCPDYETQNGFALDMIDHIIGMNKIWNEYFGISWTKGFK